MASCLYSVAANRMYEYCFVENVKYRKQKLFMRIPSLALVNLLPAAVAKVIVMSGCYEPAFWNQISLEVNIVL